MYLCVFLLAIAQIHVFAGQNAGIEQFIGYYLCDTKVVEDYANPEVFSLRFNGEGQLQLYTGMLYGTTGTSTYYDYESFRVEGNILTAEYKGAYGYYGEVEEIEPGSHQFVLNEDGSIAADDHVWYRRESAYTQEAVSSEVLLEVRDVDFPCGVYTPDTTFLGTKGVTREEIETIIFLDTLEEAPEQTWDVSAAQDDSVKLWIGEQKECTVYIAAEGGVSANYCSNDLFRLCTNLREIDFNYAFDVSGTADFSHMFRDCENLLMIRGLDTLNTLVAYNFNSMFRGCKAIRELDLGSFTTSAVHDMSRMFYDCKSLEKLTIDNFVFNEESIVTDIFTGTKWENSSPLLEDADTGIAMSCILDTSVLLDNLRLRARVLTEYDQILEDSVSGKVNSWGEWEDTSSYIFYDMCDINVDGIPELIVCDNIENMYYFTLYYFDVVSCTARKIKNGSFNTNWPELYLYPEEHILEYSGPNHLRMNGGGMEVLIDYDVTDLQCTECDFTLAAPQRIEYYSTDLFGDGSDNTVEIYATCSSNGNYNYFGIYVDNSKVFEKSLDAKCSQIEQTMFYADYVENVSDLEKAENIDEADTESEEDERTEPVKKRMNYLYIRVGSDNTEVYTAILGYENGSMSEKLKLSDLINESQLSENNASYFSVDNREGTLNVKFYLDTIGLGERTEFSMDYDLYTGFRFRQHTFVDDIDPVYVMASKSFDVYKRLGDREEVWTVNAGDSVYYDKIWFSGRNIWVRVKNAYGQTGWAPIGNDPLLRKGHTESEDSSFLDELVNSFQEKQDFDLYVPDADSLFKLGEQYYEIGDYDTAEIYYDLVNESSSCYDVAQEKLSIIRKQYIKESDENETQSGEESANESGGYDERILYAEYLIENANWFGNEASYAVLDVNGDGRKELLIYYGYSNGNCELYTYDEKNGQVQYAGSPGTAREGMYYSQQYQELVYFYRASDTNAYTFQRFDGKNVDTDFTIGWHDEKGDTYSRHFYYMKDEETVDLGSYVYVGEAENAGKTELEQMYQKYLEYMIEIEFKPINEFYYENDCAYAYEFSTENIPIRDLECMLPVVSAYLNSSRGVNSDGSVREEYDLSYQEADFWGMMQCYSIFDGRSTYNLEEIPGIAYALFDDYDGTIPDMNGMGIQVDGDNITFFLATPEEQNLMLTGYTVLEDRSIDAEYYYELMEYSESSRKVSVHFEVNDKVDYASYTPLYYRITSLKVQSDDVENIRKERTSDQNSKEEDWALDEFIFADSDRRYLTVEDLQGMDAQTLRYARNEIYARYGRRFKDQELQNYFDSKSWYVGLIAPEDFKESTLSDIERKNAELILAYENGEL